MSEPVGNGVAYGDDEDEDDDDIGSDDTNYFQMPGKPGPNKDYSSNALYQIGQVVTLSWVKNFSTGTLTFNQDNRTGDQTSGPSRNILENTSISEYEWIVSYMGLGPTAQNVYYLSFNGGGQAFGSHYFNITGHENDAPVSTASPTPASTTSITSTGSSSTLSFVLPTDRESSSATPLAAGEIAGIAVGVTLGVIIVAGVLGFFGWRFRKRRAVQESLAYDVFSPPYRQDFNSVRRAQQSSSILVAEMEGSQRSMPVAVAEMDQQSSRNVPHFWRYEMPS
ncbi:hypothetical protein GQX73_g7297 [Xylaria multiplex]|uniref:Mid2 domain-containing protein n=1 Tax=Xylaria multiplex TaxID=323545 RepID=A0A7C8ITU0_9PEZI|nr:hypothetical protein GQX73_g7297 [Xylaria multiplex]